MKIIAIRLKNLTSIEGSVEIDFTEEPLALREYLLFPDRQVQESLLTGCFVSCPL